MIIAIVLEIVLKVIGIKVVIMRVITTTAVLLVAVLVFPFLYLRPTQVGRADFNHCRTGPADITRNVTK